MLEVIQYNDTLKQTWDTFVEQADNGSFLFQRHFMEYHKARFEDYSLLVYKDTKLVAILPANITDSIVHSHQGLSYGGLVSKNSYLNDYFEILSTLLSYLNTHNISKLQLNPIPNIYTKKYNQEIDYALFLLEAKRNRSDAYFVINPQDYNINRNRKRALKVAEENQLSLIKNTDFTDFWTILNNNLAQRFQAKPTHTLAEISLLQSKFPNNIKLFEVKKEGKTIAGAVIFLVNDIAHIQYSSADESREATGSMDFLFQEIIKYYSNKKYISFGISGEDKGRQLNAGLVYWKQSFGAQVAVQNYYLIETANYKLLNTVFR